MSRLAALKAQFGSEDTREANNRDSNNLTYPFWNMKPGQRAIIRFLPDKDATNPRGFLLEKSFHNLTINGKQRSVPDLAMYGLEDPISALSRQFYKADDKVNGKKYWRKKQYITQCIIVEDPLPADKESGETHVGKVRVVTLGFQIYNIIKEAFTNQDEPLEADPDDFNEGYDFIIKKTEQGEYSTYTMGTKFMTKQRALSEDELMVAEAGMVELKTLLPKNPGLEKVQAMLNADLNGEEYSDGASSSAPAARAPAPASTVRPSQRTAPVGEDDAPVEAVKSVKAQEAKSAPASSAGGDDQVDDMLAQIRARRKSTPAA